MRVFEWAEIRILFNVVLEKLKKVVDLIPVGQLNRKTTNCCKPSKDANYQS